MRFGKIENMLATLRHRHRPLAVALLLALSALCVWLGEDHDALISAGIMNVDGEDAGDGRRWLRVKRVYTHPAYVANRLRAMSAPGCNGVLLTSMGGVGSTKFISALESIEMRAGGAAFYTNDDLDADGFKHRPAAWWTDRDARGLRGLDRDGTEHCFGKALVIVGEPVHTIESVVRRFGMKHINKLKRRSGLGWYPNGTPIARLYDDMAAQGTDTTGIAQYIKGWYEASLDREHWPDVRIVTARTLFNHAKDHARWIGVEEKDMYLFERLSFDESKQHKTEPSVTSVETAEKVMDVLAETVDIVNVVDNLAYEGGGAPRHTQRKRKLAKA